LNEARKSSAENDGASHCGSARRRPRMASKVAHRRFESLALEVLNYRENIEGFYM